MAPFIPASVPAAAPDDAAIWDSLKEAIAKSSGFESWKHERAAEPSLDMTEDRLVRRYLRETLETLAY
ncbi:MAG: hypothetical protein MH825_01840 [Cyanobacteria bacterium]|nr:hypothetical protein [Cyanobacteriota bacterium]